MDNIRASMSIISASVLLCFVSQLRHIMCISRKAYVCVGGCRVRERLSCFWYSWRAYVVQKTGFILLIWLICATPDLWLISEVNTRLLAVCPSYYANSIENKNGSRLHQGAKFSILFFLGFCYRHWEID